MRSLSLQSNVLAVSLGVLSGCTQPLKLAPEDVGMVQVRIAFDVDASLQESSNSDDPVDLSRGKAYQLLWSCSYPPLVGDSDVPGEPQCFPTHDDGGDSLSRNAAEQLCKHKFITQKTEENPHWSLDTSITRGEFVKLAKDALDFDIDGADDLQDRPLQRDLNALVGYCRENSPCFGRTELSREKLFGWMQNCFDEGHNSVDDCEVRDCCPTSLYRSTQVGNLHGERLCKWEIIPALDDTHDSFESERAPVNSGDFACYVLGMDPNSGPDNITNPDGPGICFNMLSYGTDFLPSGIIAPEDEAHPECPPTQETIDAFLRWCATH